eukprot:sb/3475746/
MSPFFCLTPLRFDSGLLYGLMGCLAPPTPSERTENQMGHGTARQPMGNPWNRRDCLTVVSWVTGAAPLGRCPGQCPNHCSLAYLKEMRIGSGQCSDSFLSCYSRNICTSKTLELQSFITFVNT